MSNRNDQRVLLTGANGFLGAHILKQLLDQPNTTVRAVVRSQVKVDALKADFPSEKLDFAIVPDMTVEDAFASALSSTLVPFTAVIHTASPFLYKAVTDPHQFLDPAIKGTTQILSDIKFHAPSVRRVALTSSFAAVGWRFQPGGLRGVQTEENWNLVTMEDVERARETGNKNVWYQASKTFAEKAAWSFVKTEKPNFDLVTFCPPMLYGPLAHTVNKVQDLNESTARIYNLFVNSNKDALMPDNALYLYADPREVARAHIGALSAPEAGSQRFLICAGQITSQSIADILRANFAELADRTPVGIPGQNTLPEVTYTASQEKAARVLGIKSRSTGETFVPLVKQLLAIEKAKH